MIGKTFLIIHKEKLEEGLCLTFPIRMIGKTLPDINNKDDKLDCAYQS